MNDQLRKDLRFSDHACVSLFECLIVAGAPAVGLMHETTVRDRDTIQLALQLLRDMWKRADSLYIPRADLESLHAMECKSTTGVEACIQPNIAMDARKLSRYYIYLLFRYCMSSAVPTGHFCLPVSIQRTAALSDIPGSWIDPNVSTNYPSAPPIPVGGPTVGIPYHSQWSVAEHRQYPVQQHQERIYHTAQSGPEPDRKHQDQIHHVSRTTAPVSHIPQRNALYPNIPQQDYSASAHGRVPKGSERGTRVQGVYDSEEEY